ncbi:hypothetical protein RB200_19545 [Streptomyces sp. PmtG]
MVRACELERTSAARTRAANRLAEGSTSIWERRTGALTAWVRAGRREDLDGWQAILGVIGRLVILGGLACGLWLLVRAVPWLLWALVALWCWAAWRSGRALAERPAEPSTGPSGEAVQGPVLDPDTVARALHDLASPGVHIVPLARALGATTQTARTALREMGVPVADGVRMQGRGVSPGVRAADMPPLPAAPAHGAPSVVAAGQASNNNSNNTPGPTRREGLRVEHIGASGRLVTDPTETIRHHKVRGH